MWGGSGAGGRCWGGSSAWGEPPVQPRVPSPAWAPHNGISHCTVSKTHPRLPQQQEAGGGRSFPALVPLLQESGTLAGVLMEHTGRS